MLTIHRSGSPLSVAPQAISWHWISPVTVEVRGSQHLSWRPAGSIAAASSEWSGSDQICPLPATAIRSAPTATPMARSNLRKERTSCSRPTPTATS